MSNMELFNQTYEFSSEDLFNIPEDVKYPIFNDDNAKMVLDQDELEREQNFEHELFLGEAYHGPNYTNCPVEEVNLGDSCIFDFECTSPKLEDSNSKVEAAPQTPAMITAESGNMSFENIAKIAKQRMKQIDDYESANELTNELTDDQELKYIQKPAPVLKSRFSKSSSLETKPQSIENGDSECKTTRRRSSRPKLAKSSTITSEDGSSSTKGISLAKRKDVVNKTLLRSVKRYYTSLFEQFMKENQYSKQERREYWKEYIDEFTKFIFGDYINFITVDSGVTIQEVNAFMASMIVPNNIKRSECEEVYTLMMEEFSNLLYKYSIKRLQTFVKNPSVTYVLRHYIEKGPLDELLENDVTLSKNRSLYMKASKEILSM